MAAETLDQSNLAGLEAALPALRPELHRYCARMTGSVVDGEDVLQDALLNAARALRGDIEIESLRAWLFRIAHNTALNYIRARNREQAMKRKVSHDMSALDPIPRTQTMPGRMPMRSETADNLRPFLALTPKQRSAVILRDVLGYSAAEVADLTETSVSSVKSALHRGRAQLKACRADEEWASPPLTGREKDRLAAYANHFNAHEFDTLRDMLAAEAKLELVAMEKRQGKAPISGYFSNYQKSKDWLMAPGQVEGKPAMLVFDRQDPSCPPRYFVLLDFKEGQLRNIRDFRYARYAIDDAQWERV